MSIKTDLAGEIIDGLSAENLPKRKFHSFGGVDIAEIRINSEDEAELLGKPEGIYFTVEAESLTGGMDSENEILAIAEALRKLLPKEGNILAVGIGNSELTADSLGTKTVSQLSCGSFAGRKLHSLSTGICAITGFEPYEMISSVLEKISPSAVILADSLRCDNMAHIGKTVQLTDSGIVPGSGAGNHKAELSMKTLGVPTVAIGVPTVLPFPNCSPERLCAPSDIDLTVKKAAKLLSLSIELAVFPTLGLDFIRELMI